MEFPDARILVFCKAPVQGKVKTRLAQRIGDGHALRIHKELAYYRLQNLATHRIAPVQLWCAPDMKHSFFQSCRANYGVELYEQAGEDLGEKMSHAVEIALGQASYCVVVGTDCPAIDATYIHEALAALQGGADGVIGPAEDGGYVLVGLSRPMPDLFAGIEWGTSSVLAQTRPKMVGRWRELATLWDIDRYEDLPRLRQLIEEQRPENLLGLLEAIPN